MEQYLEADSIFKVYGRKTILSDVYLRCEIGDKIAIWGRNGCGKSALFRIIFGSELAQRKFVRINGKVMKLRAYHSGLIGYLPQFDYLPQSTRVSSLLKKIDLSVYGELIVHMIERIWRNKVKDLSCGERRLVEVVHLLSSDKPFIILDEPFTGISPIVSEEICKAIDHFLLRKASSLPTIHSTW